jgi:hypothetical protein
LKRVVVPQAEDFDTPLEQPSDAKIFLGLFPYGNKPKNILASVLSNFSLVEVHFCIFLFLH